MTHLGGQKEKNKTEMNFEFWQMFKFLKNVTVSFYVVAFFDKLLLIWKW